MLPSKKVPKEVGLGESDPSAAGGGGSEVSAGQRSIKSSILPDATILSGTATGKATDRDKLSKLLRYRKIVPRFQAIHYGMIATGNHEDYRFAARSTTPLRTPPGRCASVERSEIDFYTLTYLKAGRADAS